YRWQPRTSPAPSTAEVRPGSGSPPETSGRGTRPPAHTALCAPPRSECAAAPPASPDRVVEPRIVRAVPGLLGEGAQHRPGMVDDDLLVVEKVRDVCLELL